MVAYQNDNSQLGISRLEVTSVTSPKPLNVERWAPVVFYAGVYEVSDLGHVRRARSGRLLAPYTRKSDGHLAVELWSQGRRCQRRVYQLVADAWLPQTVRGTLVVHRSTDLADCSAANLEWLTPADATSRWLARHADRPRLADGRFARLQEVVSEIEAQAVHEGVINGY